MSLLRLFRAVADGRTCIILSSAKLQLFSETTKHFANYFRSFFTFLLFYLLFVIPDSKLSSGRAEWVPRDMEPARQVVGPIIINSGFRNSRVNRQVGGVANSQHLFGQAADIRPKDPQQFQRLVEFLKNCEQTDQLLTGNGWLHVSWNPLGTPRRQFRIGYYK